MPSAHEFQYPALAVGPCAAGDADRIYISRTQSGEPFSLLVIDPDTGEADIHPSPVSTETDAPGIAAGRGGKVYIGTRPSGHLLCFDPRESGLTDLGQPCPEQTGVWCLSAAPDGTIYGGTSPEARLFACAPETGETTDLGRVHGYQPDLRYIEIDPDGRVYCGLGPNEANVVRYSPDSKHKTELLPKIYRTPGYARPVLATDEVIYVILGERIFEIEDKACIPLFPQDFPGERPAELRDGREVVGIIDEELVLRDPETGVETILELP